MQSSPPQKNQQIYRTLFWLFLTLITIFRLLLADKFGLGVDESHYLLYSRHLAWGYFDHPPMVAFLAALTTLFGDGVFWVRLGPILCSTASLILLRYLVLTLYQDERLAFGSMVLLQMMPYQHLLMVALLPDATLNLFWCGTLLAVWKAIKTGKWSMWILSGLLFGGTLLSDGYAAYDAYGRGRPAVSARFPASCQRRNSCSRTTVPQAVPSERVFAAISPSRPTMSTAW